MQCENFKALMDWQIIELRKHIQDNQYYMGEKLHHFIQYSDAEKDFFIHYSEKVCSDLRITYCTKICEFPDCPLRKLFKSKQE